MIAVDGVFDGEAAAKLCALLVDTSFPAPATVVIDFSQAREVTYIALAALLNAPRKEAVRLKVRGLAQRHHRIVRFLASDGSSMN